MASEEPPQHAGVAALAEEVLALGRQIGSVGREVEALRRLGEANRRRVADQDLAAEELTNQLRSITRTLAGLAEQLAELAARVGDLEEEDEAVKLSRRSLFDLDGAADVHARLTDLVPWVSRVYLRYHDSTLADCWLWHPDVVEELLWLHRSWVEAFRGKTASTPAAADWHERHRPGVRRRIREALSTCGLEQHTVGAKLDQLPPRAPVADDDTLDGIAIQWAARQTMPAPTADQLAQASGLR